MRIVFEEPMRAEASEVLGAQKRFVAELLERWSGATVKRCPACLIRKP